jgi:thioredoxin 2
MEVDAGTTHVVCPHCQTTNRVRTERLAAAQCGSCSRPLFDGHPVELNTAQFERQLARSDVPLVVDFWAPWCGPCRAMAPQFEAAARELEPDYRLVKVNTDAEPDLAARYRVQSIPTLAIFRNGREVTRMSGLLPASHLADWVRRNA